MATMILFRIGRLCTRRENECNVPLQVKLGDELGSGTFGKVFSGIYHDPETGAPTSCAVKAVKEEADYNTVRVFLSEAEFMKPISTEHVVKLVGVVSVSMPHLILMELVR